jgi:tetratricopeptide (TPR) repeat protein
MEPIVQPPDPITEWLRYAPAPLPLPADKQWHVFLSYRSVNRPWVLALYDALNQAGYRAFLDQFVLVPGDSLPRRLEEALDQSASGIIIWSSANRDSEWVRKEYDAMVAREADRTSGFRFVIAKLDADDLPAFARTSLHEDFSASPEGPRGSGLFRVMYGLAGRPPSDEAVRFAARVDQEAQEALLGIEGAKFIGDAQRIVELAGSTSIAWRSSPLLMCRAAQALIDMKENAAALRILDGAVRDFPKSIRPKQLRALALARTGEIQAAQRILSELYAAGHRDPETLGLFARTWMDRYKAAKERRSLEVSRDLYAEAFRLFPSDSYTGINAAAKCVFLGDLDKAVEIAKQVEEIAKVPGANESASDRYWRTATLGEAQLIRKDYAAAAETYARAVRSDPLARASHESTLGQARLLMENLATPEDERKKIEAAFAG